MMTTHGFPSSSELRTFGLLCLVFFAALGGIAIWRPQGLLVAALLLSLAWVASMIFSATPLREQSLGFVMPLLFAALGYCGARSTQPVALLAAVCGIGVLIALSIWAFPRWGRHLYAGWSRAGEPLGWSITRLVLGGVYYLILTPVGLVMQLLGRDPLHRHVDPQAETYWVESRATTKAPDSYFRQF